MLVYCFKQDCETYTAAPSQLGCNILNFEIMVRSWCWSLLQQKVNRRYSEEIKKELRLSHKIRCIDDQFLNYLYSKYVDLFLN